jgi:hypothetical protein
MNRREFLVFAGVGAIVAAVAPKLLSGCSLPPSGWSCTRGAGHEGPCAAVETVQPSVLFSPNHSFRLGDVIQVSGCNDNSYNGKWMVMDLNTEHCFVKMADNRKRGIR